MDTLAWMIGDLLASAGKMLLLFAVLYGGARHAIARNRGPKELPPGPDQPERTQPLPRPRAPMGRVRQHAKQRR